MYNVQRNMVTIERDSGGETAKTNAVIRRQQTLITDWSAVLLGTPSHKPVFSSTKRPHCPESHRPQEYTLSLSSAKAKPCSLPAGW
jgi:hypothetical protein